MKRVAYTHYRSFTKAFIKGAEKVWTLNGHRAKDFDPDRLLEQMLTTQEYTGSIDRECLALELAFERNKGRVLMPEPTLCEALKRIKLTPVEGDAWQWPFQYSMISIPAKLKFGGVKAEGLSVSWIDASELANPVYSDLYEHWGVDDSHFAEHFGQGKRLIVTMAGDPDGQMPTMIRYGFTTAELTEFINSQAVKDASFQNRKIRQGSEKEQAAAVEAVRFVIALGFYLASYPGSLTQGIPAYVGTKLPPTVAGKGATPVGLKSTKDFNLVTSPHVVNPHWRQLRDQRFYRGDYKNLVPGSRYTLVSGYEVNADRAAGVQVESSKNSTEPYE